MSKNVFLLCWLCLLSSCSFFHKDQTMVTPLPQPSTDITKFNEIAVKYPKGMHEKFNQLTPQERIFVYYLYRASLPGNRILADQLHRHANELIDLFYTLYRSKETLMHHQNFTFDSQKFIDQAACYLVQLWTNHSQYFLRESANEKRTPHKLNLDLLTPENITVALKVLGIKDAQEKIATLNTSLFDATKETTLTVPNSIEQSAVNFYEPGFTEKDYATLPEEERAKNNNHFYVKSIDGKTIPQARAASTTGYHAQELQVAVFWLKKAMEHAKKYPHNFDGHLVKSLELLIAFFTTGDENIFKQHSIEWLKSSSRIDYCIGFIESYQDPKGIRGSFQAEATIKSLDLASLKPLLTKLEQQLPFPAEFKRSNLSGSETPAMNSSMNYEVFGTGELGPLVIFAAYCLPNCEDIRAHHGSKQIIYPARPSLAQLLDAAGYRKLFFSQKWATWLEKNDPQCTILEDLFDLHCTLHESIGHGSGKLATHTFKEGEPLTIGSQTYKIGDSIPVTPQNIPLFLAGYESTIEEFRADSIAYYIALTALDELLAQGFLKKWAALLSKQELLELTVYIIAMDGFKRLIAQPKQATTITGDHARNNWTITSYLRENGCFSVKKVPVVHNNKTYTAFTLENIDIKKTTTAITTLMQQAQHIKSTGDGQQARQLLETYGIPVHDPDDLKIMQENNQALVGNLKATAHLNPLLTPVKDATSGEIIDIQAHWPKDIFALIDNCRALEMTKE